MKHLNIASTGYPGTTKSWRFIQEMYHEPLSAIAWLCGEKTIISGVRNLGNGNYTDGWIAVSGELYFFQGGNAKSQVEIYEIAETANYNVTGTGSTTELPTYITRAARFAPEGTSNSFAFSDLTRLRSLKHLNRNATEGFAGLIEILTQEEFNAGQDDERAVTTKKLHNSSFVRQVASGSLKVYKNGSSAAVLTNSGDVFSSESEGWDDGDDGETYFAKIENSIPGMFAIVEAEWMEEVASNPRKNMYFRFRSRDNGVFIDVPYVESRGLHALFNIKFFA